MLFGLDLALVAVAVTFWIVGRKIETVGKIPQAPKFWSSFAVALVGSLTFSASSLAQMLADGLSWIFGLFGGGTMILGCLALALLVLLIFGLLDQKLDKRDITAMMILPVLTLGVGGVVGDFFRTLRGGAHDFAMSAMTTLIGG